MEERKERGKEGGKGRGKEGKGSVLDEAVKVGGVWRKRGIGGKGGRYGSRD